MFHPDAFDINRKPNRHYAFGFGAHRCLGANLARVELQVLIQEVLRRLPDYQVVPARLSATRGSIVACQA